MRGPRHRRWLLADTYSLYLMTHGYHRKVTGPMFRTLHLEEYLELRDAVDQIEGGSELSTSTAPGSYAEMGRLTSMVEDQSNAEALDMVRDWVTVTRL